MLIFMCSLAIVFAAGAAATQKEILTDKAPTAIDDNRYLKLLSRVEKLEDRDRQQQAEIRVLRSELNTEKQRTSRLEAKLFWLMLNIAKHGSVDVKTTAEAEGYLKQDTKIINAKESVRDTRSATIAGEQTSRIRRQEAVNVIAFHATQTNDQQHIGMHQSIAFDNVITNIGAAYNPHYGTFIAPVPGVYVFSTTILSSGNLALHCSIARNGISVATFNMRDDRSIFDSASATAVLQLNKGDDIVVLNIDADKFICGGYSMFSGFLLHEDQPTESIVG